MTATTNDEDLSALAKGGKQNVLGFLLRLLARIPFLFIVGVPLCIPFLFIAVFYYPNTILTNAITRSHENAVKRYE